MQRRTLKSFNQVNFSPKNASETKKVKRLDALLKIVFDCISHEKVTNLEVCYLTQNETTTFSWIVNAVQIHG
jgi:hypothetical protein